MNPQLFPDPNLLEFGGYIQNFGTIRAVLDDTPCSTQAALDLTSPIANSRDSELYLRTSQLWVAFISVVEQIPESHAWQDGIIHLLHEITKVPRPARSDLHLVEDRYRGHFWDILPAFGFNVPGEFFKAPWERRPEVAAAEEERNTPRYTAIQWMSINAFMARCTVSDLLPGISFDFYALQILNYALELKRSPVGLDDHIPAAAAWILHAGEWMCAKDDDSEALKRLSIRGPWELEWIYEGPKGFNKEKWGFWRKRFEEEARNADLKEETRGYARKAFEKMVEIEEETVAGPGHAQ